MAVRRYRRCRALDDDDGSRRTPQEKGFSYFQDTDGMYVLQGRLILPNNFGHCSKRPF
jgi:hypothetical protein